MQGADHYFGEFAATEDKPRVEPVTPLQHGIKDYNPGRTGQLDQLGKGLLGRLPQGGGDTDQDGPVLTRIDPTAGYGGGQFPFDCCDQLIDRFTLIGRVNRGQKAPGWPALLRRQKMGRVELFRQPLSIHLEHRQQVKTEKKQVHKIFVADLLAIEMGMHQPQAA